MTKKMIRHNLDFYILNQDLFETEDNFQFRTNYIIQNLQKDTFDNLIKKSRLYANMHFLECSYDKIKNDLIN